MYEYEKVLNYYGIYLKSLKQNIVCPFHGDVNASLAIDVVNNRSFCFGCGFKGNAFDFVKEMENNKSELQKMIIYQHIVKGCEKSETRLEETEKQPNGDLYLTAYNYYACLASVDWRGINSPEKQYYIDRGFTAETLNVAKAKINQCSNAYPVIFPILDNGKFKGWVCRTDKKDIEKKRKYLYNTGFRRTATLCGNYAENCIPIICEGYFDRLKLIQAGYKYPIAILGWKIAKEQIGKLKEKGIDNIISFLDSDEPGIKGTRYLSEHFNVKRVKYPDDVKDPGELETRQINKMLNEINYIEER
jgi:DNA primase